MAVVVLGMVGQELTMMFAGEHQVMAAYLEKIHQALTLDLQMVSDKLGLYLGLAWNWGKVDKDLMPGEVDLEVAVLDKDDQN